MMPKKSEIIFSDKFMLFIRIILSFIMIILGILQICGIYNQAIYYIIPLSGFYLILLSIQEWKHHKGNAILTICLAFIIFGMTYYFWYV